MANDGHDDIAAAASALALRLPHPLSPLATLAHNFWWSWAPDGPGLFASLDPHLWGVCAANPIQLLQEISAIRLRELAHDAPLVARVHALAGRFHHDLARPCAPGVAGDARPVAFLCAEFGVHPSLPTYAGGLGVLAGDYLKEASDQATPMVGVGLFYSQGSFRQRLDASGWQHEYWTTTDPARLPVVRVRDGCGRLMKIRVPIRGHEVVAQIWRVDVGRTPLYLLDANCRENSAVDRWITARLYIGDHETRLAQYTLLGLGGMRALQALGIEPGLVHLNEGHAALAALELLGAELAGGRSLPAALEAARTRVIFTTHTPVAAGNDWYPPAAVRQALGNLPEQLGIPWDALLRLGRTHPDDPNEWFGLTPFALRTCHAANGVSRRHGEVAREMWRAIWPQRPVEAVPIRHVTNGVHLPTWMSPAMQRLLDRYLPAGWRQGDSWSAIAEIPDEELWEVLRQLRAALVAHVRERSVWDRLGREESTAFAEAAAREWRDDALTIGFARRIATYKRLYLLTLDPEHGRRILLGQHPIQIVIAGKAHPRDEEAKRTVQRLFAQNDLPGVSGKTVFLEDYDLDTAARLVQGCDVWINLPRPPLEASGTSGMKSMLNGGLQLSVLDGWWAEAYDGGNGWAIPAEHGLDPAVQDEHDAARLLELLEREIIPLFYERDAGGIPRGWMRQVKRSLQTLGPRFTATRMLHEYAGLYAAPVGGLAPG